VWSFKSDPEFENQLNWIKEFMTRDVEPLDHVLDADCPRDDPMFEAFVRPLQAKVKKAGLWARHQSSTTDKHRVGHLEQVLIRQEIGSSRYGPLVFGVHSPDLEIEFLLAKFGTPQMKERYLKPLIDTQIAAAFATDEPQHGQSRSTPPTRAELKEGEWIITGQKWISSEARHSDFFVLTALTEPTTSDRAAGYSMFVVSADRPGIELIQDHKYAAQYDSGLLLLKLSDVRVETETLIGKQGSALQLLAFRSESLILNQAAQALCEANSCLQTTCELAAFRFENGVTGHESRTLEDELADNWIGIRQFRLLVLETAWLLDNDAKAIHLKRNLAAIKLLSKKILHDASSTAIRAHGILGLTDSLPFARYLMNSYKHGLAVVGADGSKARIAKLLVENSLSPTGNYPSFSRQDLKERAFDRYLRPR